MHIRKCPHTRAHSHKHRHFLLNGAATKLYHIHHIEHMGWSLNTYCFALYLQSQQNLLYPMLLVCASVQWRHWNSQACSHIILTLYITNGMISIKPPSPHPPPRLQQSLVGQGFLIIKASWTHLDTSHVVGLLWMRDQPKAKTCTWQHTTLTQDRHPYPQWYSKPQSQSVNGHRPTPSIKHSTG